MIKQHVGNAADIGRTDIVFVDQQADDRGQQNGNHQAAEHAQRHGTTLMEKQDKGGHQEGRDGDPVSPSHQPLDQVGKEEDKGALVSEIADTGKERQKQKQHGAKLPPDGNDGFGRINLLRFRRRLALGRAAF